MSAIRLAHSQGSICACALLVQGQPDCLRDAGRNEAFGSYELTMLSLPLQGDAQTEENDMNKRRRKGILNLDEDCVRRVSINKGQLPGNQGLRAAGWDHSSFLLLNH